MSPALPVVLFPIILLLIVPSPPSSPPHCPVPTIFSPSLSLPHHLLLLIVPSPPSSPPHCPVPTIFSSSLSRPHHLLLLIVPSPPSSSFITILINLLFYHYPLSILGIVHKNTKCAGCNTGTIRGMMFRCQTCTKVTNLCSTCYMDDKHDLSHSFSRYDTADKAGTSVNQ